MPGIQYFEVPLYVAEGQVTVASVDELTGGYPERDMLVAAIAPRAVEIAEDDLPEPLINTTYSNLRIYRYEGTHGPNFFGIAEQFGGGF